MNLLDETLEHLKQVGKTPADVSWVKFGKEDQFYCSWDEFAAVASFTYDNGYGGAEVCTGLKIVGADWWVERGEYDGSEWWEFKTKPEKPKAHRVPVENDLKDRW